MAVPEGGPAGRQKTEDRRQGTGDIRVRDEEEEPGGFPAFLYFSVFFVSGNYADILRVSEKELQQECGARTVVSHPGDAACFFSGECMRETICLLGTVFCLLGTVFCLLGTVFCLPGTVFCLPDGCRGMPPSEDDGKKRCLFLFPL